MEHMHNFVNTNEVFPILDLIRRELKKQGLYTIQDAYAQEKDDEIAEASLLNVEVFRELNNHPSIVSKVLYTYDNGMTETLTLLRDNRLIVEGFEIEIQGNTQINEMLEEETSIASFSTIRGTIIRENGLFKNLKLDYVRAV